MTWVSAVGWTSVDGVRVVWGAAPGPLTASLLFRVGTADETLTTHGATHLVEHLALFPLGLQPHYQNGSVRATLTSFDTQGDEAEVCRFLHDVCVNLAGLPTERLPTELRVLETEEGRRGGVVAPLLAWRFGPNGPGLSAFEELARRTMDGPSIQRWASSVFTRDNAVLVLSGPPPSGLRLPLPEGPRRATRPLVDVLPALPAWFPSQVPDIAAHTVLPRGVAAAAYAATLQRIVVDTLRFQLGIAYSPAVSYEPYDGATAQLLLVADAHPDQLQQVADLVAASMSRLADQLPTDDQVRDYQDQYRRSTQTPNVHAAEAHRQATELLFTGTVTPSARLHDDVQSLTPADLHGAAQHAWNRAVFALPDGVRLATSRVVAAPVHSVGAAVVGRTHQFLDALDGAPPKLTVAEDGITLQSSGGVATIRFATCRAALAWPDGARRLYDYDGISVMIEPSRWVDGHDVVTVIDRATRHVRVPMPARESLPAAPPQSHSPTRAHQRPAPPSTTGLARRTRVLFAVLGILLLITFGGAFSASAVGNGGAPPLTFVILAGAVVLLWLASRR